MTCSCGNCYGCLLRASAVGSQARWGSLGAPRRGFGVAFVSAVDIRVLYVLGLPNTEKLSLEELCCLAGLCLMDLRASMRRLALRTDPPAVGAA